MFWEPVDARAWGWQHFGAWFNGLTEAERRGLEDYIEHGQKIGAALRHGLAWSRRFIQDMDAMLYETRAPEAVALTRLWMFRPSPLLHACLAALQPGDVFTDRAFLSTSIGWTWGLEKQFQDGRSRLPSVILVRPGTRFLPLWGRWRPGAPTNELWRHEVLLPRDFPLHLRERADENNCYRLIFEALDEAAMSPLALSS